MKDDCLSRPSRARELKPHRVGAGLERRRRAPRGRVN